MNKDGLWDLYCSSPPIIRAAVDALLMFELKVDPIGYDISYYQEDLPAAVTQAIKPWEMY